MASEIRDLVAAARARSPRRSRRSSATCASAATRRCSSSTARHDATERVPRALRVDPDEHRARGRASSTPSVREALELAARNIRAVAEAELARRGPTTVELPQGQTRRRARALPVARRGRLRARRPRRLPVVGADVLRSGPRGRRRRASRSPRRPAPTGRVEPVVLAACAVAGVDEVYAIGGAQAIAALALGTESVAAVDVIAGPGNRYVQEAKRQLGAEVGIDGSRGRPSSSWSSTASSELEWVALDLCAQAEHGDDGLLVAIAPRRGRCSTRLAERVEASSPPSARASRDAPLALVSAPRTSSAALRSPTRSPPSTSS